MKQITCGRILRCNEQQLNVYTHIWQELRQQPLDGAAVIATKYPEAVEEAIGTGDEAHLVYALEHWEPLVPIKYDVRSVHRTIREFGLVVDDIEENRFSPRSLEVLEEVIPGTRNERFATRVCRNCDARFSCSSYRRFAWYGRGIAERSAAEYFADPPLDLEQENWRTASLDASPTAEDLNAEL